MKNQNLNLWRMKEGISDSRGEEGHDSQFVMNADQGWSGEISSEMPKKALLNKQSGVAEREKSSYGQGRKGSISREKTIKALLNNQSGVKEQSWYDEKSTL